MKFPQRLIDGYQAFRATRLRIEQEHYRELAEVGQQPETMVIGCCDSRVSPEVIFDANPGELFVVRNVANLVPPYSPSLELHGVSASLEFAVRLLKVKNIVVLGHGRCGGISAFSRQDAPIEAGDFIGGWVSLIKPAAETLGPRGDMPMPDYLHHLEKASILQTLENLMTFPWIADLVKSGDLRLHAAYFAVATGLLMVHDPDKGEFVSVADV